MKIDSALVLSGGRYYLGCNFGARLDCVTGEVCFTTSMFGYQHIITDPSFAGQIITFTFPHIGNVGVNAKDYERSSIAAVGVVAREVGYASHVACFTDISSWLASEGIVGIMGIDTRDLTIELRNNGVQMGSIVCFDEVDDFDVDSVVHSLAAADCFYGNQNFMNDVLGSNLGSLREDSTNVMDNSRRFKVALIDFGAKASICRLLNSVGCDVKVIPCRAGFFEKLKGFDGVVLSNGPGNPGVIFKTISEDILSLVNSSIPVLGVCLGHQLLALAYGLRTVKMPFGHRGANHPIQDLRDTRIVITSQNHGYVVDESSLGDSIFALDVTHRSLFDNTIAGIKLRDRAILSVQYHPEGGPGPTDSRYLFLQFCELMKAS